MLRACYRHTANALTVHPRVQMLILTSALLQTGTNLVAHVFNSSELRGAGFNLQEVIPPELESAARLGRRTRGAGLRQLEGVGRKRFVLSSDDDNELRSRCE